MEKHQITILMLAAGGLGATYLYFNSPQSYDDCILTTMGGASNNQAASAIEKSCRAKFPLNLSRSESHTLTTEQLERLSGEAEVLFKDSRRWPTVVVSGRIAQSEDFRISDEHYSGVLYNGNDDVTIESVEIAVVAASGAEETTKNYIIPITIPPKTTKKFRFNFIAGEPTGRYAWSLVSARGF